MYKLSCRAFTGRYWDVKDDGTYVCVVCGEELFKFSSYFLLFCVLIFCITEVILNLTPAQVHNYVTLLLSQYMMCLGWPSFSDVASRGKVTKIADKSYGMLRVEVVCTNVSTPPSHVLLLYILL